MRLRTWLSDTIHKKALLIALVHWYVTFFFEKDLFIRSTLESKTFTVAKIIVIFSFWQIAAYMFRRYKREADYRRFIHFSAIYFLFSMVVLLMIWPGFWGADAFELLDPLTQVLDESRADNGGGKFEQREMNVESSFEANA